MALRMLALNRLPNGQFFSRRSSRLTCATPIRASTVGTRKPN
jgi:hypothetical protein